LVSRPHQQSMQDGRESQLHLPMVLSLASVQLEKTCISQMKSLVE